MKIILKFAVILASGLILGVLGMLVGAYIGGNYAVGFQFNGVRGYEAASQIGFILGAGLGVLLSWLKVKNR